MISLFSRVLLGLLLLSTLLVTACNNVDEPAPVAKPGTSQAPAEDWDRFVTRQLEEYIEAHPQFAVMQGRHEFDGQLPDWSRAGIEREIARLHKTRDEAMAFADSDLSKEQLYQREYLVSIVDQNLFWVEKLRLPFRGPQFYLGWAGESLDPSVYITLDYASPELRMRAYTRYLKNVPKAIAQIRENLEMPMPRTWLQLGIDDFSGYASYFSDEVPSIWAGVENEDLQSEFTRANAQAIEAMQSIADWLTTHLPTATEGFAMGVELFEEMLWDTERVDIPLARLEAIAHADMARNLEKLNEACAEFAPGDSVQACFKKMSGNKPKTGSIEAAREQVRESRQFIVQEDLVGIPGSEEARVEEAPPYARSDLAYINIPGAWEKSQPSTYYISPPNPAWPEDVQADYIAGEADLLFVSVHEVWPGHFLNFLHANRAPFFFGRVFVGYAFAEGWAHYTEEMMFDAGFRNFDPEARIGLLSNALLRNARFLSSIGLHTKGWSVEDSKRFFMEEAFQSEGTAIQQAARGTYDPSYLNYTMGKLMIKRLREDWTAARGGRAAWREFHDEFLSYGGPPIPLVRQQMMGETNPMALFPQ